MSEVITDEELRCVDCLFAHRQKAPHQELECRIRAPAGNKHGQSHRVEWPVVDDDDWCGEFKPFPIEE